MIKRIVVAGCRDFNDYGIAKEFIDACVANIKNEYELVFISGGCRGADALGERYAAEKGYKTELFAADWDKYGKAAGPIRNKEMAKAADFIICFWDGKSAGTKSMIAEARRLKKPLKIKEI